MFRRYLLRSTLQPRAPLSASSRLSHPTERFAASSNFFSTSNPHLMQVEVMEGGSSSVRLSTGSSLSHTNQWCRHISPRSTTREMYNALCTKGQIGVNTAQQSVLQLCDGLIEFINDEELFSSKVDQLAAEAAPKRLAEAQLKKDLMSRNNVVGFGKPNSQFERDREKFAKESGQNPAFYSPRIAAKKAAQDQWSKMVRGYHDLLDKKKAEQDVKKMRETADANLNKKREETAANSSAGSNRDSPFSAASFAPKGGTKHSYTFTGKNGETAGAIQIQFPKCEGPRNSMGIYLWGDVGVGKTMMMDLFEMCPTPQQPKRRCHLHSFVTDLHKRLHNIHQEQQDMRRRGISLENRKDPMEQVAEEVVAESRILCFDEFQTFDVANASLLAAFFKHAFRLGIVLFATSNRPPEGLLRAGKGLVRFVPELYEHCAVVHVEGVGVDYRVEKANEGSCHNYVFSTPNSKAVAHGLLAFVGTGFRGQAQLAFQNGDWEKDMTLSVYNRSLRIPRRLGGVAVFPFSHICGFGQMLGPADFQLLAKTFHTIILTDVPHIATTSRNGLKQFIILVDELYQHHVKLLFTAAVPWKKLLKSNMVSTSEDDGRTYYTNEMDERTAIDPTLEFFSEDEMFEFRSQEEILSMERVASRLEEMGSISYLTKEHIDFVIEDFDLSIYEKITQRRAIESGGGGGDTHFISMI